MANVIAMASAPPMSTRTVARLASAPPRRALIKPVTARAMRTAATVIGMRSAGGGNRIASSGSNAPTVNAIAEEMAACHGLVSSWGSMPSSMSMCAANASWSVSSSATVRAVAGDSPLAS